jgi:2-keto-4-pentenoate hydratase/2-oxohepta-3-ene-1,7-dioic acid hydratase in catechol pathway
MRLVRARHKGKVILARLESGSAVVLAEESGHPAADVLREVLARQLDLSAPGPVVAAGELTVLAPARNPAKILCVGLNYAAHAAEAGVQAPAQPVFFAKTTNTITGPGKPIRYQTDVTQQVDYEAELVAVIGRRARDVPAGDALRHVLGYTIGNDVSARDAQFGDGQWMRGKSMDTFAPIGPAIVTADELGDAGDLAISCRVNGTVYQNDSTKSLIHGVADLVSYASRFATLEPGDLLFTGTPEGVGFTRTPPVFLQDGDMVEVEIGGLGVLANPVRAERA